MIRRPLPGTRSLLAALLLLLLCASARADDTDYPDGPEGGAKLAAALRNMRPDNARWRGDLKIQTRGPDGRVTTVVPATGETVAGETQWRVIYTTLATNAVLSERLTVIHALDGSNQYLYARAAAPDAPLGPDKSLSGPDADVRFAGSDFWLSDLGFEFYHWPDQRILKVKSNMVRGRPCLVLQSSNPDPRPGGYSRVVSYIDRETGGPIQAEAFGADGKTLKEFSLGHFRKVNDRWELKQMEIDNDRTRSRTILEFDLGSQDPAR